MYICGLNCIERCLTGTDSSLHICTSTAHSHSLYRNINSLQHYCSPHLHPSHSYLLTQVLFFHLKKKKKSDIPNSSQALFISILLFMLTTVPILFIIHTPRAKEIRSSTPTHFYREANMNVRFLPTSLLYPSSYDIPPPISSYGPFHKFATLYTLVHTMSFQVCHQQLTCLSFLS